MQRRTGSAWAIGVVVGLGGCAAGVDDAKPATEEAAGALLGGPCPDFGCGANSPMIDTFEFHDLSLIGTKRTDLTDPNDAGYAIEAIDQIAQISSGGTSYDLKVVDGRLIGSTCVGKSCSVLEGRALLGATIDLRRGEAWFQLTVGSVRPMPYFVGGGRVEAYTLLWEQVGSGAGPVNLCNNITLLEEQIWNTPGGMESAFAVEELMGMRTYEAVVYEGDRIDGKAKTMSPGADDSWFNIGCAGHTLSKLLLTRNTVHAQTPGMGRAWEQRQATLKMLAADYCDAGVALTVAGQRLVWTGDRMTYHSPPREMEARWTETGATCLTAPRMLYPTTELGEKQFPQIGKAIKAACKSVGKSVPKPCPDPKFDNFDGADRISANP